MRYICLLLAQLFLINVNAETKNIKIENNLDEKNITRSHCYQNVEYQDICKRNNLFKLKKIDDRVEDKAIIDMSNSLLCE